ncbi:TonB-dependent siderophore receptor [Aliarcobacter thereius]|uniref:Ferrichrome-iron receptor n=1 Tax=Aliarcobacter thereius LMG 24486 TaxID=1032240 RepID=A0A1C7WN58_9BACT|nr:TonB-dependent receptor [Aliarcobacter thereius]OCL92181.1 Ferrichrome-iron receptor precursor [Aliarcobacter thereius]OCL94723.1 Ferrichrome-iron receptor precursor [Aliarcobacter thereius LMG 24486]QBF15401.1 TonB-dependent siderophore receptor [Aliarcobacter thereius LMG 24486]TLS93218.1 TonB-dependent receptor [Aliarcobacter thereius]
MKIKLALSVTTILAMGVTLNANDTTRLDEITVKESKDNSSFQSNEISSINRNGLTKEDMAKSIQIFNKSFIEDAALQNIDDIITNSSNTVYTNSSHGRTNEISMRGFSGVPILYDGIKLTNKIARPEVFGLDSIEVLKGPDSLQYGQSSPGGLVNLVKKKPTKNSLASIEFETTDNPSYSPKLDIGGALNENKSLYFRLNSVLKYDEGWTNSNTDTNKVFIAPSLAYDINDNNTFTFISEYTDETTPSDFGTYVNSKGKLVAPIKNTSSHPDEKFEKTQKIAGFDFDSVFETWNSNFKYRYIDYKGINGNVHMPSRFDESTNTLTRLYAYQKQEFSEHALQYTFNKEFDLFNKKNHLSIGSDYNRSYSKTTMFFVPNIPYNINLSNPSYEHLSNLSEHPNARDMTGNKKYLESYGIFLQDSLYLSDDLILNAGIRYSESKPQNGKKTDAITPSFGIVYNLAPKTSIFANYSESFNPNSATDINNNILDPETGKGYELGIKQKLFNNKFDLSASIFKINKENIALPDPNAPAVGGWSIASGEQESQGLELDLSGEITDNWSIIASYGYTDTKNKDLNNNKLKNIPNHTANLFTTYKLASLKLPDFYIGGGVKYLGSKYADDSNNIKLDSVAIYNATIGYKKANWRANLSVQNLTNKEYVNGAMTSNAAGTRVYVGTPRTFLASIAYKF